MLYVTRAQWGARRPLAPFTPFVAAEHRGLCFHYSGNASDEVASHALCASRVRGIQAYHQTHDYIDIAYNFLICIHGYVFEGRGLYAQSGAQGCTAGTANARKLGNVHYHALCFLGNDSASRTDLTRAAKIGLLDALWYVRAHYPGASYVGHRDICVGGTDCPGNEIETWVQHGCPRPR